MITLGTNYFIPIHGGSIVLLVSITFTTISKARFWSFSSFNFEQVTSGKVERSIKLLLAGIYSGPTFLIHQFVKNWI